MDFNLALACVGYGSIRVLREREFSTAPFALPAHWILAKEDPVQFCVEAMRADHPDWAAELDGETRLAVHHRLLAEAGRTARGPRGGMFHASGADIHNAQRA